MGPPTEPKPKTRDEPVGAKADWRATSVLEDVEFEPKSDKTFDEVLKGRRTRRDFDSLDRDKVFAFLRRIFSMDHIGKGPLSGLGRKSMISAGALHPLDVVIVAGDGVDEPILFADRRARFVTVPVLDQTAFSAAVAEAKDITPQTSGHLILFAGDKRRVSNAYEAPESLLWRDCGAALQICSMAACAYGYAFCPLGLKGDAILSALGPPHPEFMALGLALLGR